MFKWCDKLKFSYNVQVYYAFLSNKLKNIRNYAPICTYKLKVNLSLVLD
jgi:hypothetical protein